MNPYIADQIAREHVDRLLADAAVARRARSARKHNGRGAARPAARNGQVTVGARTGFLRPLAAVHAWFAAGQL